MATAFFLYPTHHFTDNSWIIKLKCLFYNYAVFIQIHSSITRSILVMRHNFEKLNIYTIFLVVILFLSSCITSNRDLEQRRLALYFLAENIGSEINIDDQTIVINEFKFALDRFSLYAENDIVLQTSGDVTALIYSYDKNIINDRLVLDVDLGFRDIDRIIGYELFAEPVSNRTGVLDSDFFGQDSNYSVIIRGTVNDLDFNFRSSLEFERKYDFSVVFSEDKETIVIRNIVDLENVFTSSNGGFLDPLETENEEKIVKNIRDYLVIQVSTASIFEAP